MSKHVKPLTQNDLFNTGRTVSNNQDMSFLVLGPHLSETVRGHLLLKKVALLISSQPLRATMPQSANGELYGSQTPTR